MIKSIFKFLVIGLMLVSNAEFARAQTAALLPMASQQFFDNNGNPLSSGKVYFQIPGQSTPKTVWQDANQTTPWTNPILLNAAGRPPGDKGIYGNGTYRQIVKDRNDNLIWDQPTSAVGTGGGAGTNVGDGNSVGSVMIWGGLVAPNQYQFAYGQALSRAVYPELFQAITQLSNAICVGGNTTITGLTDTSNIPIGAPVEGVCIASGSTVISKTLTSITLSIGAVISTSSAIRIFPYGNGDGSTTFNVMDLRGRVIPGRTNMGGVVASNLTSTYFGSNPDAIGAIGGNQSHSLLRVELPATAMNSIVTAVVPATPISTSTQAISYSTAGTSLNDRFMTGLTSGTPVPNVVGTGTFPQTAVTITGTLGSGTAFSLVQPALTMNYVVKVTPDTSSSGLFGVASIGGMQGIIACGAGLTCAGNIINVANQNPSGTNGQIQYNNSGVFGGFTMAGDCTVSIPNITCTKTNGVPFASVATSGSATDLITGTLNTARLPSPFTNGTISGNTSKFVTTTGTLINGNCVQWDVNFNAIDAGAPCGTGGGTSNTFDTVAALNAASVGLSANSVTTLGYYARGDGGGTTYVRVASAPSKPCSQTSNAGASFWDLPDRSIINVKWCGAHGDGTTVDNTFIANSISAVTSRGGTVYFPAGQFNCTNTCINLLNVKNYSFVGVASANGFTNPASTLMMTGTNSNPMIKLDGTQAISFRHLGFYYNTSGYTGNLIDLTTTGAASSVTSFTTIQDFAMGGFGGGGALTSALSLINARQTIDTFLANGWMYNAAAGIIGGVNAATDFNNVFTIDNVWFDKQLSVPVVMGGQQWTFRGCIFEPPTSTAGQPRGIVTTPLGIQGLTIQSSNFADASNTTGAWLDFVNNFGYGAPGGVHTVQITTSLFQQPNLAILLGSNVNGIDISNNQFYGVNTPNYPVFGGASAKNLTMFGNYIASSSGPGVGVILDQVPLGGGSLADRNDGQGLSFGPTNANYVYLPGKKLMQWGTLAATASYAAVTFPTPFGAGPYVTVTNATNFATPGTNSVTSSGFQAAVSTGTATIVWTAIGPAP